MLTDLSNEDEDYCKIINLPPEMISLSSDESNEVILIDGKHSETVMLSSDSEIEIGENHFPDDIHLNIQSNREDSYDGNVSDVNSGVTMQWDWTKVNSPVGWTKSMKRYYNKPCKRQRYFDWEKVLSEIRLENRSRWSILKADLFPIPIKRKRCLICRQTDHLSKLCPRQQRICTMCGVTGHLCSSCPEKKCLNCGKRTVEFKKYCGKCRYDRKMKCSGCKKYGHEYENCPDLWRRFHCTVAYQEMNSTSSKLNENIQCCNCAKVGHLYEECKEVYWSKYTPTSCIVTNYYKDVPNKEHSNSSVNNSNESTSAQYKAMSTSSSRETLKRNYEYDFSIDELKDSKRMKFTKPDEGTKLKYANPFTYFLSMFPNRKKKNRRKKKKKSLIQEES